MVSFLLYGPFSKRFRKRVFFFCSSPCYMFIMPFSSCTYDTLLKCGIFIESKSLNIQTTNNTNANSNRRVNTPKKMNYNPFIDIKCSYLSPKDLNSHFFGEVSSCLTIFHNNVRSTNKNLMDVEEIFRNSLNFSKSFCPILLLQSTLASTFLTEYIIYRIVPYIIFLKG